MAKKQGPQQFNHPNNWSDERKHLFRKMVSNNAEDLIRTVSKYRSMKGVPQKKIVDAIYVAKYILLKRDGVKPKDVMEIVAYYEAVGKIVF